MNTVPTVRRAKRRHTEYWLLYQACPAGNGEPFAGVNFPLPSKQDRRVIALLISDNHIGFTVTIEISNFDASRCSSYGKA